METHAVDPFPPFVEHREIADLVAVIRDAVEPEQYPNASTVDRDVVVYDMASLGARLDDVEVRRAVRAEIAHALSVGPGIVGFTNAVPVHAVDQATMAFETIISAEAGANNRIWNALEKLALADPDSFLDYYASDALAVASEAWLGPAYQMTSQVNVVNPGGAAQSPHRDYHLGFMTNDAASAYPAHVHQLSPALTLQGAVAHVDMPVESGPTKLLPHSQKYLPGYLAWRDPAVMELFEAEHRQLPLRKGDAMFFNPAVLHAAGSNNTPDVRRMANLLQVSSAFGRAMESVDRERMIGVLYPGLAERRNAGMPRRQLAAAIAATAEGYPFPTNLDLDPPIGGLAPPSQADVVWRALDAGWSLEMLQETLRAHTAKRCSTAP